MPEVTFRVRWPDNSQQNCYSPSSTVRDFFALNTPYPLHEFLERSRRAMHHASERVRQRYGFACSSAMGQLQQIENTAAKFAATPNAQVVVESFEG
jgi:uncharacterized repeat protein (TIGR04042 family)